MVEFKDISMWEKHEYLGTGGTRDKVVVENPDDNCLYYFKTSLIKKELLIKRDTCKLPWHNVT